MDAQIDTELEPMVQWLIARMHEYIDTRYRVERKRLRARWVSRQWRKAGR